MTRSLPAFATPWTMAPRSSTSASGVPTLTSRARGHPVHGAARRVCRGGDGQLRRGGQREGLPGGICVDRGAHVGRRRWQVEDARALLEHGRPPGDRGAGWQSEFDSGGGVDDGFVWQVTLRPGDSDPDEVTKPRFDRYGEVGYIGTSMATPHVSGTAALLISRGIKDPKAIEIVIKGSALDLGSRWPRRSVRLRPDPAANSAVRVWSRALTRVVHAGRPGRPPLSCSVGLPASAAAQVHASSPVARSRAVHSIWPAKAASAVPQAPPRRGIGYRLYFVTDVTQMAAADTFSAVAGSPRLLSFGGGAEMLRVWQGLFIRGAVSRATRTGERVVVFDDEVVEVGIPHRHRRHTDRDRGRMAHRDWPHARGGRICRWLACYGCDTRRRQSSRRSARTRPIFHRLSGIRWRRLHGGQVLRAWRRGAVPHRA